MVQNLQLGPGQGLERERGATGVAHAGGGISLKVCLGRLQVVLLGDGHVLDVVGGLLFVHGGEQQVFSGYSLSLLRG